ncbi:dolichyl-P-Man:Man(7)GlcNAc(2)-PP-dolichol alpha-1,6-mannosyltransferase, partial [Agyrium rufum]|nr:dolichyl-P-Man:Man(7)GlcNAc(2)-PP-dolichol alpha-1,6-mannosyltransferase [Agyrium rufum]
TPALRKLLPSPGLSPETQRRRYRNAFMLLTIAGVVFRAEIAVLIAMHAAYFFLTRRISLYTLIEAGAMGLMIGLAVSVPLDSLLWQRPVWPELSGFIFNVLNGKAVEWGTSPWHAYFTRSLPNLLLSPLTYILLIPTAILQPALRSAVQDLLIPNLAFIAIYSIQPHKEARFIVYAIPPLTAAASLGASWIWTRRSKGAIYNVLNLALVTSTLATFAASIVFVLISCLNYPGAEALSRLHMLADGTQPVLKVHMDTLTCMTGVTRFSEIDPQLYIPQQSFPSATDSSEGEEEKGTSSTAHWVYSKMENQTVLLNPLFWEGFDYAITETPERVIGKWELREWVYGYAGIGSLGLQPEVETKDVVRHMLEGFPAVVRDVVGEGMVMMEKWTRRATGGRWIGVRMEKKLAILQKQHSI